MTTGDLANVAPEDSLAYPLLNPDPKYHPYKNTNLKVLGLIESWGEVRIGLLEEAKDQKAPKRAKAQNAI